MKSTPYTVSELEWLDLQLRLLAVERRAPAFTVMFEVESADPILVTASVFAAQIQSMYESKASRDEQLEYYRDWHAGNMEDVTRIVSRLPALKKVFKPELHVQTEIMYSYGMGGQIICTLKGLQTVWK